MKQLLKIMLLTTVLCSQQNAEAQFFKKLGNKIANKLEKKVETRIEKKANKAGDEALNAVEGKEKSSEKTKKSATNTSSKTNSYGGFEAIMNTMGKEVNIEDEYSFHTTITMDYNSNSGTSGTIKQSLGNSAVLSEMSETKMIMDTKNDASITISEEKKEVQIISMSILDAFTKNQNETDQNIEKPQIIKKNGTKKIIGYTCKNVIIQQEDMTVDLWYTNDIKVDTDALMGFAKRISKTSQNTFDLIDDKNFGFVMQMDIKMKKGEGNYSTIVKDINKSSFTINMKDYKIAKH